MFEANRTKTISPSVNIRVLNERRLLTRWVTTQPRQHSPDSQKQRIIVKLVTIGMKHNNIHNKNIKWHNISAGLAGGIYWRYLPPVFTGKYRHGQYSPKWRLPAFTGIYKYFINFSSNYIVDSPSYLLYYTWTP